ncbi:MAG: hypothetical protein QOE14_1970 [Humisphaera sp.]|nr:hypothetical protein [Humisphaera sp.]
MRFHSSLDDVQWNAAARQHTQMRANLHELRRAFPPRTRDARAALRAYRNAIQDFGREVLKPRVMIDGDVLNDLSDLVALRFAEYAKARDFRGD